MSVVGEDIAAVSQQLFTLLVGVLAMTQSPTVAQAVSVVSSLF